jgi:hypothetical protein
MKTTKRLLFATGILSLFACNLHTQTPHFHGESINQLNYYYDTIPVTLEGTLKIESYFGPPGFGDNPNTDKREDCYILCLDNSINVLKDPNGMDADDDDETYLNNYKIELAATNDTVFEDLRGLKYQQVRVTGTFFGKYSPNHHTDVLLSTIKATQVK